MHLRSQGHPGSQGHCGGNLPGVWKWWWSMSVALALAGPAADAIAVEEVKADVVEIVVEKADIQSEGKVLATTGRGKQYEIKQTSGPWYLIEFANNGLKRSGWVHRDNVKVLHGQTVPRYTPEEERLIVEALALRTRADALFKEGTRREALQPYAKAAELLIKVHGEKSHGVVYILYQQGSVHYELQEYAKARDMFQRAAPIYQALQGKHANTADAWHYAGLSSYKLGDNQEALAAFEQARAIREKLHGKRHQTTATVVVLKCDALARLGRYAEVSALLEEVLPVYRETFGATHGETLYVENSLVEMQIAQSNFQTAGATLEKLLAARRESLGARHAVTAKTMATLGSVLVRLGKSAEARPMLEEAVTIHRQTLGNRHAETAGSLTLLGKLHVTLGDFVLARRCLEEAVQIHSSLRPANSLGSPRDQQELSTALFNLAEVQKADGDTEGAVRSFEQSLEISTAALGPRHPITAAIHTELGGVLGLAGRSAEARKHLETALEIHRQTGGEKNHLSVQALGRLAQFHSQVGEHAKALEMLQQVVAMELELFGPKHADYAAALIELGRVHMALGQYAAAKKTLEQGQIIYREALGANNPYTADAEVSLARALIWLNEYEPARQHLREAVPALRDLLGASHPAFAQGLMCQSFVEYSDRKPLASAEFLDQARRASRRHAARVLPGMSESEQLAYLTGDDQSMLHFGLRVAHENPLEPQLAALSAEWLINGKSLAQEVVSQRIVMARGVSSSALAELIRLRTQMANLAVRAAGPQADEDSQTARAKLEAQQRDLARELGKSSLDPYQDDPWIDVEQLRRALPADALLVSIARFQTINVRRQNYLRYAAWLIPPAGDGEIEIVDLGQASLVDALVKLSRSSIEEAPVQIADAGEVEAEAASRKFLRNLAMAILDPVLAKAGKKRRLLISPDAHLWLVPWNALPLADGRYAIEEYKIDLAISGRELIPRATRSFGAATAPLVVADPDYDATMKIADAAGSTSNNPTGQLANRGAGAARLPVAFSPLTGTAIEAAAIAPSIEKYAALAPQMLLRGQATEAALKTARSPKVLALCTHGFFLPDQEDKLVDSLPSMLGPAAGAKNRTVENPLLRCGLVLAGANRRGQTPEDSEDGILTGLEIVGLDLRGTELVVLSACETGVGQVNNGEGVAGLRQAFQLAGAKAVLATLWKIPDRETAQLMDDFWKNLAAGKTKSDALREAQLELIRQRKAGDNASAHPFYWAAFTLSGQ